MELIDVVFWVTVTWTVGEAWLEGQEWTLCWVP